MRFAWAPELVAAIYGIRSGWGDPIAADPSLSLIDDFAKMSGVPGADEPRLKAILCVFYTLHMDHGGGNLSTFAGKAIASAHSDIFMSMIGSMAALSGPLQGRANQDCLDFVRRVGTSDPEAVERFVRETQDNKGKIPVSGTRPCGRKTPERPSSTRSAQIVDERVHTHGGKGIPICRPKYIPENQPKRSTKD